VADEDRVDGNANELWLVADVGLESAPEADGGGD